MPFLPPNQQRQSTEGRINQKKGKTHMLRSNSKSLGNHVVSAEKEKERLQWEGFAEKEGY